MNKKNADKLYDHSGSSFDSFLQEQGIQGEVEAVAAKRVLAWQIERAMKEQKITKTAMAHSIRTSRSQLDRLLDPGNMSVTLEIIVRAVQALGKELTLSIAEPRKVRGRGAAVGSR